MDGYHWRGLRWYAIGTLACAVLDGLRPHLGVGPRIVAWIVVGVLAGALGLFLDSIWEGR